MASTRLKTLLMTTCVLAMGMLSLMSTAAADATTENVTKMKDSIVETLATWVPFVVLFVLLGIALSAIGIKLFNHH